MFNNTNLSTAEQDAGIVQFHRNAAMLNQGIIPITKTDNKTGRAMSKVMTMFNGHGRGVELSSVQDRAYGLLCAITEFTDHERRAMSTDHGLDSAWFGSGASIKQRGLE